MPVRGAKVRRSGRFADIEAVIKSHGFVSGCPGRMASPGFYFFHRGGFVLQILPARKVRIVRPDRSKQIVSARRLVDVDSALEIVILEIEESETGAKA
jgi:hypothetical protein